MKKFIINGLKDMFGIPYNRNNVPEAALKETEPQNPGTFAFGNSEEIVKMENLLKCHPDCRIQSGFVHSGFASNAESFQAMPQTKEDRKVWLDFRNMEAKAIRRYSKLPSFMDVAAEVNMTVRALYQRLHGEGVLFRRRGRNGESEKGGNFGNLFIYAGFSRKDLFMTKSALSEDEEDGGETAATLKVTEHGQRLIRELAKIPSAKAICSQLSQQNKQY